MIGGYFCVVKLEKKLSHSPAEKVSLVICLPNACEYQDYHLNFRLLSHTSEQINNILGVF